MKHSFKVSTMGNTKEGVLSIRGDITIAQARQAHKALLDSIREVDTLVLDLQGAEVTDVSFIQLICATHRECSTTSKTLTLLGEPGEETEKLLERSGYSKQQGCTSDAKKSCVWGSACL